jgi:hypothetical protein
VDVLTAKGCKWPGTPTKSENQVRLTSAFVTTHIGVICAKTCIQKGGLVFLSDMVRCGPSLTDNGFYAKC